MPKPINFKFNFKNIHYSGRIRLYFHIAFWVIWFGFIWVSTPFYFNNQESIFVLNALLSIRNLIVSVTMFYCFSLYFSKQRSTPRNLYLFHVLFIAYFFLYLVSYLSFLLFDEIVPNHRLIKIHAAYFFLTDFGMGMLNKKVFWYIIYSYITFVGIPLTIKLLVHVSFERLKALELQRNNVRLELDYLKSQVNPHFLFNTLNSIYFYIVDVDPKATDMVLKLSDLFRYTLYEANQDFVTLDKEIKFIKDAVLLENVRNSIPKQVNFDLNGNFEELTIPPFLLSTIIESIFQEKKGIQNSTDNQINIDISAIDSELFFKIKSNFRLSEIHQESSLLTVQKRLSMQYHNNHSISFMNNENSFDLDLWIQLKKHDLASV